jgi:hypothetical protein
MARFFNHDRGRVWFYPEKGEPAGPFHIVNETRTFDSFDGGRIELTLIQDGPPSPPNINHPNVQEDTMPKNISTKEQVEVRTQMADVIKEAIEAKFGKVKTWVETESVGPLGGVSAKVLGAVEYEGVIVPFAINVYSDDRISEALEEQLETDAENDKLRGKLGW